MNVLQKVALCLCATIMIHAAPKKQHEHAQQAVSNTAIQSWIKEARSLDEEHQERLLQFLQSMANSMESADEHERKKIAIALHTTLEHTQKTLQIIETALEIAALHTQEQDEAFNLQKVISNSSSSQGQMRANVSAALKAITVQDPSIVQLSENLKKVLTNVTSKEIQEKLNQEKKLHTLIKQVYSSATVPLDIDAVKLYGDLLAQLQNTKSQKNKQSS